MRKFLRLAIGSLMIASTMLLGACGKKPPECADPAAVESLHKFLNDAVFETVHMLAPDPRNDTGGLVPRYLATWKFNVSEITTAGYDEKSRTRTCAGKVALEIPDIKVTGNVDVQYAMQVLEDAKSGEFKLTVSKNYLAWARNAAPPVLAHYRIYSVKGTWAGIAQCDPTQIEGSFQDPISPLDASQGFTIISSEAPWLPDEAVKKIPVKVTIEDGQATMTITGPDGALIARTGPLTADGTFKTTADDAMKTAVLAEGHLSKSGTEVTIRERPPNFIAVNARVRAIATEREIDARLKRYCGLDLRKQ